MGACKDRLTDKMRSKARLRRGLTLAELLVATTIMLMIATAVATLAASVHSTNDFCKGYVVSAQHARVVLSRIERSVQKSVASEQFPGCLVVTEQAGSQELPSTLVVWCPSGSPAFPAALPLISEIVVYGPDPVHPNELLEIRSPTENSPVPAVTNVAAWRTLVDRLKTTQSTEKIMLTDRLRTAPLMGNYSDSLTPSELRGCVRFRRLMAPSQQQWSQYQASARTWVDWQNLNWPLDSYRSTSGTRAVACQTELQIAPGSMASAAATAIPFYGSAFITYELSR
jgi:prepilin-type N-terminal cleavage/methylation domain-containing protein